MTENKGRGTRGEGRGVELLAFIVVVLVLLLVTSAHGEEPPRPVQGFSQAQLAELYAVAYGRAGMGIPERAPRVYVASRATLSEMVCGGTCEVRAAQFGDAVFLAEDLDSSRLLDASIVVHEFVHYLQWARGGPTADCELKLAREEHALLVQAEWLDLVGVRFARPGLWKCT